MGQTYEVQVNFHTKAFFTTKPLSLTDAETVAAKLLEHFKKEDDWFVHIYRVETHRDRVLNVERGLK